MENKEINTARKLSKRFNKLNLIAKEYKILMKTLDCSNTAILGWVEELKEMMKLEAEQLDKNKGCGLFMLPVGSYNSCGDGRHFCKDCEIYSKRIEQIREKILNSEKADD